MARFTHLHTHSHYSFLQALPKIEELIDTAKKEGMEALALTDAGNLHGAIDFYKYATKKGIKPIIGVDAYLAPRSRHDRDQNEKRSRIVLLAENMAGYENLLKLVTAASTEGMHERPRIDLEILKAHADGLIALVPSFAGASTQALAAGDADGARAVIAEYQSIFGKEDVYLEVSHHPKVAGHTERMDAIRALGKETGAKVVAQHDVYYLLPSDREATAVLRRIGQGAEGRNEEEDFSFVSEAWMREHFSAEEVEESGRIAERCAIAFDLGKWVFPALPVSEGYSKDW